MHKRTIAKVAFILLWAAGACWACECTACSDAQSAGCSRTDPVDAVLTQLNEKTSELRSYQGQIEYKFIQPLLESEALRKGVLYYAKFGVKSALRINFETLKQDDEREQKYMEHFIFDGTWLTQIDYQIKAIKRYQVTEPNKPVDAFAVASRNLPMLGFTKIEDLKEQFEVELVEQAEAQAETFIQVRLKVKPNSIYKDDYISIDFWIDKKLGLPAKVVAVSTEDDVYQIKFLKPKINTAIDKKIFDFKIPRGFGEPEIIPLEKKGEGG